jgi:hypothetical protein
MSHLGASAQRPVEVLRRRVHPMTRRIVICVSALVGLIALVATAPTASAQLPDFLDFEELFESILNSLPAFIRGFVSAIFEAILEGFCFIFGTCSS